MALNRLNDRDYIANIMDKKALLLEPGCESLVVDEENHLVVLQHNGPLNVTVGSETTLLPSPIGRLSYYCIAVSLCSGNKSSVYIGIPSSAQTDLAKISFISNYINKGWKFEFLSATLSQEDRTVQFDVKYWNGLLYSEHNHRLNISYDTVLNISVSGGFLYETTAVDFEFNGQVWHKYVTNNAMKLKYYLSSLQPSIASLYGDCTVTLNLVVHNKQEKLVLSGSSTNISIYHKSNFV